FMISNNIEYTLSQLPIYQTNLQIVVDNLAEGFGLSNAPSLNKIIENWWKSIDLQSFAFRAFGSISSVGSILFMTALYAGFLLTEVNNFNAKISKALGADSTQALKIISKVNNRIGVYLTIKTIINIILASISFLIMWVMGIDSAVFWAVMIGFLNYIPYVGSAIGVGFPVGLALAQFGSLQWAILALVLLMAVQTEAQGILRVSVSNDFGSNHLINCITPFIKAYPKIKIHMILDNRFVDLVSEGFDLAVRIGNLSDSSMKAKKIANTKFAIVGSRDYLASNGIPKKIDDLSDHQLLNYSFEKSNNFWRIPGPDGEERQIRGKDNLSVNDGKSLLMAAEAGLGLAYLPCFIYGEKTKDGSLQKILTNIKFPELGVYAVYPSSDHIPPKLRVFIDYLSSHFKKSGNEIW
ncbi:AI-2E family transporter, partial [Amylibacter sp.]|nr:AI-2E family transporter [Amylibacter sp.]